jgi:hypothetical protein
LAEEGITYHPSPYSPLLGYAGFEARLTDAPARRYFDARRVSLPVEEAGTLKRQTVEHPWTQPPEVRFTAGRIRLDAHDGDEMEFFTFGGLATVTTDGVVTICRVTSTAPLLPLSNDPNDPFAVLESEVEIMLAQRRAGWGSSEYVHLDRLGHVEPMMLFASTIAALEERLARLARVERDAGDALRLARGLRETVQRAGHWPDRVPLWDELM